MVDIVKFITPHIEKQFPGLYKEDGDFLIQFMEAYYEFLETDTASYVYNARRMHDLNDVDDLVDESLNKFLWYFKEKYLDDFPFQSATDKSFMVKHIMDYHRSKGTPNSLRLLMRLLFNEDADVYYPGKDVLRASDSVYYRPIYIEVTRAPNTKTYLNRQVQGSGSGARAFVEGIVQKRVKGKIIDVLYLSDVKGVFEHGDVITDVATGKVEGAPVSKGSLSHVDIQLGGRNNKVGDIFNVITDEGRDGQIRITKVVDATGRVEFSIEDSGYGYTAYDRNAPNSFESLATVVYVSDAMLFVENANTEFMDFETVYQPLETVNAISATDINTSAAKGDTIYGADANNNIVATGVIVYHANTDGDSANSAVINTPSANTQVIVQVESGSFLEQKAIVLDGPAGYQIDEILEEESLVTLTIDNVSGTLDAAEKVWQDTITSYGTVRTGDTMTVTAGSRNVTVADSSLYIKGQPVTQTGGTGAIASGSIIRDVVNATTLKLSKNATTSGSVTFDADLYKQITGRAVGVIQSANATSAVIEESWGDWQTNTLAETENGDSFNVTNIVQTTPGAQGKVTTTSANTVFIAPSFGAFDATNKVRGQATSLVRTIDSVAVSGAVDLWLDQAGTANGVITATQDSRVEGIVVGQDATAVGVYGNTGPFVFENPPQDEGPAFKTILYTDRDKMLSPPKFVTYEPEYGLDNAYEPNTLQVFDTDADLVPAFGQTLAALRAEDAIFMGEFKIPTQRPLKDGYVFEHGNDGRGVFMCTGTQTGDATKKSLFVVAGDMNTAAERFEVEIKQQDLPKDKDWHEFVVHCDVANDKVRVFIDGQLMGEDSSSTWDASTWLGTGTGTFGSTVDTLGNSVVAGSPAPGTAWTGDMRNCRLFAGQTANTAAVPGVIKRPQKQITRIAGGQGADFKIGAVEGTEDITINSDLVGDKNIVDIDYTAIRCDGQGSGVGFIDSVTITDGGTQYSAGQSITLSGGGYAGGEPTVAANVSIETVDGSGTITSIIVNDPGVGYFEEPTFTLPSTAGTAATISLVMDYGYGFPAMPNGDSTDTIADLLTNESITIGKPALLSQVNPGTQYTADPFIKIHNKYVASYNRHDFVLVVDNISGGFAVGESIQQDIGGGTFAKGSVKKFSVQGTTGILTVNRESFAVSFAEGTNITGATLGGSANVVSVSTESADAPPIGADADIDGSVINADGVATEAEVINSGFGYLHGSTVSFEKEDGTSPFVMTGLSSVETQGISKGFWRTTTSHLSSEKKLQDNKFYQDYSYQVQAGISLDRYERRIRRLLHVVGTEMFGSVIKESAINAQSTVMLQQNTQLFNRVSDPFMLNGDPTSTWGQHPSFTYDTTRAKKGAGSMKLGTTGGVEWIRFHQTDMLGIDWTESSNNGDTFTWGMWIYITAAEGLGHSIGMVKGGGWAGVSIDDIPRNQWTWITASGTAPNGIVESRLELRGIQGSVYDNSIWYDGLTFVKGTHTLTDTVY